MQSTDDLDRGMVSPYHSSEIEKAAGAFWRRCGSWILEGATGRQGAIEGWCGWAARSLRRSSMNRATIAFSGISGDIASTARCDSLHSLPEYRANEQE
jgi:hypothetical protein